MGFGFGFGFGEYEVLMGLRSLWLETFGFWLHMFGCLRGLKEKKPAEKMCSFWVLDFR